MQRRWMKQEPSDSACWRQPIRLRGAIVVREFRTGSGGKILEIEGRTQARVGEPYVEEELKLELLPNGYRVFSASSSEVYLMDERKTTSPESHIEKLGCQGNFIYGQLTAQKRRPPEQSDTPGYFLIDSSTGTVEKGLELGAWREAWKAVGIEEPRLLSPESMGPRY